MNTRGTGGWSGNSLLMEGMGENKVEELNFGHSCGDFFPSHGFKDLHKHRTLKFISLVQSLFHTPDSCIQLPTWCLKPNRPSTQLQVSPLNLAPTIVFLISGDGSSSFQFLSSNTPSYPCPYKKTPSGNDLSVLWTTLCFTKGTNYWFLLFFFVSNSFSLLW